MAPAVAYMFVAASGLQLAKAQAYVMSDGCRPGQSVYAAYQSADVYPGVVDHINADGTIDITYDDGDSQSNTASAEVFSLIDQGCGGSWTQAETICAPIIQTIRKVKRSASRNVWAKYDGGNWYAAEITNYDVVSGITVEWDDGSGSQSGTPGGEVEVCDANDENCKPCVDHCQCTGVVPPTPAPTPAPASMSGDPIVRINDKILKIELPFQQRTRLWEESGLAIDAKADLMTPDKQSQWFSEFTFLQSEREIAIVLRKELHANDQEHDSALSTMTISVLTNTSQLKRLTHLGSYDMMDGQTLVGKMTVSRTNAKVGNVHKETAFIEMKPVSVTVTAETAKKFHNNDVALKYSHLDIRMNKMSSTVEGGLFAELWGFVPMKPDTAKMIRSVRASE